jgi:drug/metabolite transporter (DMT)-like permease
MSIRLKKNSFISKQDHLEKIQHEDDDDEDSMIELGQIGILSSSKASLRYRSSVKLSELSASQQRFGSIKIKQNDEDNKLLANQTEFLDQKKDLAAAAATNDAAPGVDETEIIESQTCLDKLKMFKGYWFGILSAFAFCLSQVILKRAKWLVGSDHSTIRYTITLIIMFTILKYKNMKIMGPRNQLRLLLFRGFCGSIGLITVYFSLMLLNPSDVVTLMHGSIIITGILSRIFLKEKLTIAHFIGLMLTIMGVIFISKPSVLFSNDNIIINNDDYENNNNNNNNNNNTLINNTTFSIIDCNNSTNCLKDLNFNDLKPILGVSLALCGSCAGGIVYLVLKKVSTNSK